MVAAAALFSRYGFKRTSVDLLAAEAAVAKPTIYAYFEDKDAIFRAVVQAVSEDLLAAGRAALGTEAAIESRVAAALSAKFTRYWELVHASPHAEELIGSQGNLAAEIVQRFDRAFLKELVTALESSRELDLDRAGLSATAAARLLLRAASGAAYDATTAAVHKKQLTEIVRLVMTGMKKP